MMSRVKISLILAIVVIFTFACQSGSKPTATPTVNTAGTAAAQAAAEKATADAQAALDAKATADAKAAADAKATEEAKNAKATADQAAANAKATVDAQAALDATATAEAKAAQEATATAEALAAQATADAQATQVAGATATQAAKVAAQQATQTAIAAQATQAAQAILATIQEEFDKIGMSTDTGKLGWIQSDPYTIKMSTPGQGKFQKFAENMVASDFVLKSEVTWEASGGMMICGFIFRSEANIATGDQYILEYLRLSGAPAWVIASIKDGSVYSYPTGGNRPRFAGAIKMDNGATNKFVLIAEGNKFTVYINDERIGSFYDDSKVRSDGVFAFFGSEEAGTSSCKFANTWVWLLK